MDRMSLRMALLSLIAVEPRSGYDIQKDFGGVLQFVWHAKPTQIYPELARLERAGLLRGEDTGTRLRKPYSITDAGLTQVRDWLLHSTPDHAQRNEVLLRTFALWLIGREDALDFLRAEAEYNRVRLKGLRRLRTELSADRPVERAWRLGIEAGIRRLEAVVGWAEWAQDEISRWPDEPTAADAGFGSHPSADIFAEVADARRDSRQ